MICFHDTTADKEEFKSLTPFNEWKASTSSTLALCQHSTNRRLCCTDFRRQKDFFFSKSGVVVVVGTTFKTNVRRVLVPDHTQEMVRLCLLEGIDLGLPYICGVPR